MRSFVVLAGGSFFGLGVIGLAACGTKPLPFAELEPVDAGTIRTEAGNGGDGAGPNGEGNATCYDPSPRTPGGTCECVVSGGVFTTTLPCGWGLCLSSTNDEQVCVADGKVVRVPGCPRPDVDASGDAGSNIRLPPCDAGASGDASADASADADANGDADADANAADD